MARQLQAFPDQPQDTQTITLGEGDSKLQFRVRFTWRVRTASWYMDIWKLDGTAIALGRRLSPGWGPLLGLSLDGAPDGHLYVSGPDEYRRDMLSQSLQVRFYTQAEVDAAAPTTSTETTLIVT